MKLEVTVELDPKPPRRTFTDEFSYVVMFNDDSGLIALVRHRAMAEKVKKCIEADPQFMLGLGPLKIKKIVND